MVVPLGLGSALSIAQLWPAVRAEVQVMQSRWHIGQWLSGQAPAPSLAAWQKAHDQVTLAQSLNPDDPQHAEALAALFALQAGINAQVPFLKQLAHTFYGQAAQAYRQSLVYRPMSGVTWANLAFALHQLEQLGEKQAPPDEALWPAFDKGMAYGQREPQAQALLVRVALARWASLSPERQQAVQTLLQDLVPLRQQASMQRLLEEASRADLIPSEWEKTDKTLEDDVTNDPSSGKPGSTAPTTAAP